ncbi:MAG: thioredoxin family protein [Vicinamibacterales bacterium]
MTARHAAAAVVTGLTMLVTGCGRPPADGVYTVALDYRGPAEGQPRPNFSPKGTQVTLAPLPDTAPLPAGASRPARTGVLQVGPARDAWIPILATADPAHPGDLTRLFLDRNRNGDYTDDGAALEAVPSQNEKTKAWWSSFDGTDLSIPYGSGVTEPYNVSFWIVRDDGAPVPDVLRYSRRSWRSGTVTVAGVPALVAAMDGNNDAIFSKQDSWSVIAASEPDAAQAVLSIKEARDGDRMMFVADGDTEHVLEFRDISPDGRRLTFAVVDRPTTKAMDRAGDDPVRTERGRPRAETPVAWGHEFDAAVARARAENRRVLIDFETTWCGPCKTMDEWIWTDAEVAGVVTDGYVGVKLDGDIEKALVSRFEVGGYPTMVVLGPDGREIARRVGYQTSVQALELLRAQ